MSDYKEYLSKYNKICYIVKLLNLRKILKLLENMVMIEKWSGHKAIIINIIIIIRWPENTLAGGVRKD